MQLLLEWAARSTLFSSFYILIPGLHVFHVCNQVERKRVPMMIDGVATVATFHARKCGSTIFWNQLLLHFFGFHQLIIFLLCQILVYQWLEYLVWLFFFWHRPMKEQITKKWFILSQRHGYFSKSFVHQNPSLRYNIKINAKNNYKPTCRFAVKP